MDGAPTDVLGSAGTFDPDPERAVFALKQKHAADVFPVLFMGNRQT